MPSGLVFNIQRFSLHDGPGVRSTVFMKGCPLHCAWCHNPESQSPRQDFVRLRHRCMHCERCTEDEINDPVVSGRGPEDVELCPTGALQAVGERRTVTALVAELLPARALFDESHGGVTFSGGEPLMQAPFVTACLAALREEGVHTALDTCGYAKWTDLAAAAAHASIVLYDLKLMDDTRHRAVTGVSNCVILENLKALSAIHPEIWIRIPVIPGVNDDEANIAATAAFIRELPGIRHVDLLPYHATGEAKFARVGLEYTLHGTVTPTSDRLAALAAIVRAHGVTARIGGHA